MVTRPVRDPQESPSQQELERRLAAAMIAVWDGETIASIAASLTASATNALDFADKYDSSDARRDADRLSNVIRFLWHAELTRVFQPEPE